MPATQSKPPAALEAARARMRAAHRALAAAAGRNALELAAAEFRAAECALRRHEGRCCRVPGRCPERRAKLGGRR